MIAPFLALLAAASPARVPQAGEGDVALVGGFRLVPKAALIDAAQRAGDPVADAGGKALQGLAVFSYHLDGELVAALEVGLSADGVRRRSGNEASWITATIQFAMQYELRPLPWLSPFAGAGGGYYLNAVRRNTPDLPAYAEMNTGGFFLSAGLRAALWGPLGLYLEDRYAFATLRLANMGRAALGGNTISLGLFWTTEKETRTGRLSK